LVIIPSNLWFLIQFNQIEEEEKVLIIVYLQTNRDRASNVDILSLEFAQNFKGITDSWNKKTNLWLKNYVYLRLTPPNGKPSGFVTLATYMTSAFWHVKFYLFILEYPFSHFSFLYPSW